jgi:hypothetical protein
MSFVFYSWLKPLELYTIVMRVVMFGSAPE